MDADGRIKRKKNNKGIALVYMALFIVVLVAFVGIVVDIGYMYVAKGQLQNAADAAALAGAAKLVKSSSPFSFGNYSTVRRESFKFACANKVVPADSRVFLVYSSSVCDPITTRLNTGNRPDGDIVVGFWDGTTFHPQPGESQPATINAVKVVARKTSEPPDPDVKIGSNPVTIFFGRVLSVIGLTRWSAMSAKSEAIATRAPLKTPGITLCMRTCQISIPPGGFDLILQKDPKAVPINNGMAWTAFSNTQAPNIGANGDVVDMIWGRKPLPTCETLNPGSICNLCITTNNGVGKALDELRDAFESPTHDAANKTFSGNKVTSWHVAVPIIDNTCNNGLVCTDTSFKNLSTACPPGTQGNTEPLHVSQIAEITISSVNTSGGTKGITIADEINCMGCPTEIPLGKGVKLVK